MDNSELRATVGVATIILALAVFAVSIIYSANHFGNQLAKQCINKGHNWVLVGNFSGQNGPVYECRK